MLKYKEVVERVEALTNAINNAAELECLLHSYSDIELYLSARYFLASLQAVLGKKRVQELEASFRIVPPGDVPISC